MELVFKRKTEFKRPPKLGPFSTSTTGKSLSAKNKAEQIPAMPPPITTFSFYHINFLKTGFVGSPINKSLIQFSLNALTYLFSTSSNPFKKKVFSFSLCS